jgi:ATP-binding protein involved in chromosome partitioning
MHNAGYGRPTLAYLLAARLPSGTVDKPTRIEIEGGTQMLLVWQNDTEQRFSARELRAACPCASCREPEGAQRVAVLLRGPIEVGISEAKLVGGYGINLTFRPDGHRTGIFSYDYLRSLQAGDA